MLTNALFAVVALAVGRVLWRVLSRYLLRSSLDNIPGPPPESILSGNFRQMFSPTAWAFHDKLANEYGPVVRTTGLLGEKQLYVSDPKALHHIVVKDQNIYEEHPQFISTNTVVFGKGLLSTLGEDHRRQRKLMNPVFSTSHIRSMTYSALLICAQLRTSLETLTEDGPREIDMLEWISRTALELIGRSGLGHSFDDLTVDATPHPYTVSIKELAPAMFRVFFWRVYVLPHVHKLGPAWLRRLVVNVLPMRRVHDLRDKVDLMWANSKEIYSRKLEALRLGDEAVTKQVGQGKDILSLLIRANMKAEDPLDEDELLGQMSTIIFAAMDTTSSALSRTLSLLVQHTDVQERLRAEIRAAKKDHDVLSYDQLDSLPYLDAVCRETLRLSVSIVCYSQRVLKASTASRHCLSFCACESFGLFFCAVDLTRPRAREDVVMPFSRPIVGIDGKTMNEVHVPKDTPVIIAIQNANRDPDIWGEDAKEWKPERWLQPLPDSVADAHMPGVYGNLMTFLGGGRSCIGFKFSQLEMKVVLVELLDAFKLSSSDKDLKWRMSVIVSPYLQDQPERSQLPIVLSEAP
ncbi:cytochrome P450 [Schizophyllum commune H4-8]|uniref:Cytochrome P450 n=1 Tax=Schizophyllum commune (strain H4-8 / FGSC 9210) TaxID=578458 RepID=D8QCZ4_SCHCM|nr:cytochrome P450 [Schizophyllum commune H4-8]KAI5889790.1 cytochrome P450 [Schizophyllum commune H4-8]